MGIPGGRTMAEFYDEIDQHQLYIQRDRGIGLRSQGLLAYMVSGMYDLPGSCEGPDLRRFIFLFDDSATRVL